MDLFLKDDCSLIETLIVEPSTLETQKSSGVADLGLPLELYDMPAEIEVEVDTVLAEQKREIKRKMKDKVSEPSQSIVTIIGKCVGRGENKEGEDLI